MSLGGSSPSRSASTCSLTETDAGIPELAAGDRLRSCRPIRGPWGFESLCPHQLHGPVTEPGIRTTLRPWVLWVRLPPGPPPSMLRWRNWHTRSTQDRDPVVSTPARSTNAPVTEWADVPRLNRGSCGFKSRPGYHLWACRVVVRRTKTGGLAEQEGAGFENRGRVDARGGSIPSPSAMM